MTKQLSKGTCYLCHGEFSKAAMTKHLQACQHGGEKPRNSIWWWKDATSPCTGCISKSILAPPSGV